MPEALTAGGSTNLGRFHCASTDEPARVQWRAATEASSQRWPWLYAGGYKQKDLNVEEELVWGHDSGGRKVKDGRG